MSELAILGGEKAVRAGPGDLIDWPIITPEVEEAVLEVLRAGSMSGTDVTKEFEKEYAAWHGMSYALAHNTGTAALQARHVRPGHRPRRRDHLPQRHLLGLVPAGLLARRHGRLRRHRPADAVHRPQRHRAPHHARAPRRSWSSTITAYPADMDTIMAIARKHKIAVIEDVSHAHGALYKGRMVGTSATWRPSR